MPNDEKKAAQTPPETPAQANAPAGDDDSLDAPASAKTGAPPTPEQTPDPAKPKGGSPIDLIRHNLWLIVFGLVILAAGVVVYVSMQSAKPTNNLQHANSLTSQQLASLKGNTTLVGDSKTTLDVQSNSVFEGQVLLRSDLNVAGKLNVGGSLSLPSITVGGNGTFGQVGISGGLNVGGDSTIQGQLTVQKNLTVNGSASFGSLSVSQLSVTSLSIRSDLNISQHIVTSGGIPGHSNGTALGSGGTASVSGSDTAGTVNINTGSLPPAGCFITIDFTHSFANTPHVVISPSNSSAASLQYYTNRSTSNFSICSGGVPGSGTNYVFDYIVVD